MSEGVKMPLAKAQKIADCLVEVLAPCCERIAIAGSIRRRKPLVGDVELVAIPKLQEDLFGGIAGSFLDGATEKLIQEGRLQRIKGGSRYQQFLCVKADCKLDLFIVTRESWSVQFAIRTGPADFSKRLVTSRAMGGFLPEGWRVSEGRLWDDTYGGTARDIPEEDDLFALLGMKPIPPEQR